MPSWSLSNAMESCGRGTVSTRYAALRTTRTNLEESPAEVRLVVNVGNLGLVSGGKSCEREVSQSSWGGDERDKPSSGERTRLRGSLVLESCSRRAGAMVRKSHPARLVISPVCSREGTRQLLRNNAATEEGRNARCGKKLPSRSSCSRGSCSSCRSSERSRLRGRRHHRTCPQASWPCTSRGYGRRRGR